MVKLNNDSKRQVKSNNDGNNIKTFKFNKNDIIGVKILKKELNYNKEAYLVEKFKLNVNGEDYTFSDNSDGEFYLPQHKSLMEQIFDDDIGNRLIIKCLRVPAKNSNGQYSKAEYEIFNYGDSE